MYTFSVNTPLHRAGFSCLLELGRTFHCLSGLPSCQFLQIYLHLTVSLVIPKMKRRQLESYIANSKLTKIQIPLNTEIIHQDQVKNLARSSTRWLGKCHFWYFQSDSVEVKALKIASCGSILDNKVEISEREAELEGDLATTLGSGPLISEK